MPTSKLDEKVFLNVDLDIYSKTDLQPLVDALGDKVRELWVGRVRRTYEAHLELEWRTNQTPTSIIVGFSALVKGLPPSKRRIWNTAKKKSFDIGLDAPNLNCHYWTAVSRDAVRAAADVGAQIAITVYGPMKVAKPAKRKRPSSPAK